MSSFVSLTLRLVLAGAVLAGSVGCVSSRETRNGVFDENQYVRKDFLVHPNDANDPGWIMQGTIEQVSTPNPLGGLGLFPGSYSYQALRFAITSDKLQMISNRSIYAPPDASRTDAIINAWSVTNVDLKYRVNLDGEITNFYEENQEQPWERRQWIKLSFDKNDLSDFAALDPTFLTDALKHCVDFGNSSATLVPHSFLVDEKNNYLTWKVQVAMPLVSDDPVCAAQFDATLGLTDRATVTAVVMYSLKRLDPLPTVAGTGYQPLEVPEKDPIRRKYGVFETITGQYAPRNIAAGANDPNLIDNSGLLSARQLATRFDPNKDIVYYFEDGVPDRYKKVFSDPGATPGGIAEQTNALFKQVGVKGQLMFKEANADLPAGAPPREFGDIRYSFVRYMKDPGFNAPFTGLGAGIEDPRTGERIKSSVVIFDSGRSDTAFIYDSLLTTLGASPGLTTTDDSGNVVANTWPDLPTPCMDGDTAQVDAYAAAGDSILARRHNQSTLFNKLQQYMNKPATLYGALNPSDFVTPANPVYLDTYFDLLPQYVFGDPFANAFVTPEGGQGVFGPTTGQLWEMRTKEVEFEKLLGDIDRGITPYNDVDGPEGIAAATAFANHFKELTLNHQMLDYTEQVLFRKAMDAPPPVPLMQAYTRGSRRCVNGAWETPTQWMQRYIDEYFAHVLWHEFGHNLGLRHNFMGSVDQRNFPTYTDAAGRQHYSMMTSSVMEYWDVRADSAFHPGWGPYDQAAIAWLYTNNAPKGQRASGVGTLSVSGQKSKTEPWNDPLGFRADGTEINYLFCTDENVTRTPLCQRNDYGTTPAQINASFIDLYDFLYQTRNQRAFYKFKSFANYGTSVATTITNLRRFIPFAAEFSNVGDVLRRLKIPPPDGTPFATWLDSIDTQLTDSITNGTTMTAAFHKAVIQQASGERPFSTSVDQRFGDVNVQGIIIDKVFSAQGWLGLAPVLDQNPNTTGRYSAPYTEFISDLYSTVALDTLDTTLGGGYDTYPWLIQSNIALFAQDSHSQNFNINFAQLREWTAVEAFTLEDQFLQFFQGKAKAAAFAGVDPLTGVAVDCSNAAVAAGKPCAYDPRNFDDTLQTVTLPDGHTWVWMYLPDRNMWIAAERDRNPVTYRRIRDYTTLLAQGRGSNDLYNMERPIKFYVDAFLQYR